MSDHNTGHEPHGDTVTHGAGHEMDVPPTKELFNIVWGLGALTLLSLATCVQLFNNQQRDLVEERGKESSQVLAQYRQGMDAVAKGNGELTFKDSTGAEIKQRYVPLASARDLVLAKPERLQAGPAPKGWQHPDDIAGAAAAGAAPAGGAPGAVQAPPGAPPVPTGTAPAEGVPTDGGIVPGNPGSLPGPSTPGAPAADPKVDGAAGTGTPAAAGTPGAGTDNPKVSPPGVAPATGAGAGNGKADAGKSGQPTPAAPTPAAPTPAGPAPAAPAH